MTRRVLRAAVAVGLALAIAACADPVTSENYAKIELGMDYASVVAILGEPDACEAVLKARSCRWGKDPNTIDVKIVADKVVFMSSSGL